MASELVVMLVLVIAPGANDLPTSVASGNQTAVSARRTAAVGQPVADLRRASEHAIEARISDSDTHVIHQDTISIPETCCCQACVPTRVHRSLWGIVGLPSPCNTPGDMTLHIPYRSHPHNFYYFRPYNYFHIEEQQREVMYYGGNPRHPYANKVFQRVYDRTVDPFAQNQPEAISPPSPGQ
ncbi:MAG: hypothetical protein O3C40_13045 [Planctomycetota bacterium]|nr:hypothetical protein [Planctomycetota bacterium]